MTTKAAALSVKIERPSKFYGGYEMTTVYNQLYDNEAYCALAQAIADHMGVNYDGPTQEYLDVMVAIQDKAIGYSLLEPAHFPMSALRICYHKEIYPYYLEFMGVYAQYYRDKTQ